MPYRNKVYVAFDADSDIRYYRLMCAWKQSDRTDFNFHNAHDLRQARDTSLEATIKRSLRERLRNSKVFVVLIGDKTRYLYRFVRWEIEQAITLDMPIINVNLNGMRQMDPNRCPALLRNHLCVHISFNAAILQHALQNWSEYYWQAKREGKRGAFYYNSNVYANLGL